MLEPAEIGRHDEILQSVVAHNARRRAQRHRAARNRHYARLGTRLAVPLAFGVAVYFVVVLMSGLLGLGKGSSGDQTAATVSPPAAVASSSGPFGDERTRAVARAELGIGNAMPFMTYALR